LQQAARKLDRAAAHKVIHRNAAARTKSRLSAKLKALKTPAAPGA
jgi:ribosomal protein S20